MFKYTCLRPLAAALAIASCGAAQANFTIVTTQPGFLGSVSAAGVDNFNDLALAQMPSPLARSTTGAVYTYTANVLGADPLLFVNVGLPGDTWLSPNSTTDVVQFDNFSNGVKAVGGLFFATDIAGALLAGTSLTVVAIDVNGLVASQSVVAAATPSFVGFVSTVALKSLTVNVNVPRAVAWPTVNDLVLANPTAAVPELETYVLMLAGLGVVGFMAHRRRG